MWLLAWLIWVGVRPWVFVFAGASVVCGGGLYRVGVFVWGVWFWGVVGLAGGVGCFTMVRLALGCGVCIMKGVRLKGKPRQRGGGREVPRRGTNNE